MDFLQKELSISDFLPQSKNMIIKNFNDALNIINILDKILIICDLALTSLINYEYKKFDPLIGENSCQIRGYLIYYLFSKDTDINNLNKINKKREEIKRSILTLNKIKNDLELSKKENNKNLFSEKSKLNIDRFILEKKINVLFSKEMSMLVMLYFLSKYTITNNDGIHTGINYSSMCSDLKFSKTLSRRIVHQYQVIISDVSCLFIKFLSRDISHIHPYYEQAVDLLMFKDDDNRSVLPCYLSMDILLKHMTINNALIIINNPTNQKEISYYSNTTNLLFELGKINKNITSISRTAKNNPCVTFRGISGKNTIKNHLLNNLSNLNLQNILLASTARHPQYPGKVLSFLKYDPFSAILDTSTKKQEVFCLEKIRNEFLAMKKWALENGCCYESSSNFFATHVFCDKLNNYIGTSIIEQSQAI